MEEQSLVATAALGATIVSTIAVVIQVWIARRQANLDEAATYRDQTAAWRDLSDDWQIVLVAGLGPERARQAGVSDEVLSRYVPALRRYKSARVQAQLTFDTGSDETIQDLYWSEERDALDELAWVEQSIRRVLTHCAQVADLIIRRRISVHAVYDALGHDVLRDRDALVAVTRYAYDYGGCIGGVVAEGRSWAALSIDEVSLRIGWGRALENSPGTLARIDYLIDALAIRAFELGDGTNAMNGDYLLSEVGSADTLPLRWRVLWPTSLRTALHFCWRAASIHHERSRPNREIVALWRRLPRGLGSLICRPFVVTFRVTQAAVRSGSALDEGRWVPAIEAEAEPDEFVVVDTD